MMIKSIYFQGKYHQKKCTGKSKNLSDYQEYNQKITAIGSQDLEKPMMNYTNMLKLNKVRMKRLVWRQTIVILMRILYQLYPSHPRIIMIQFKVVLAVLNFTNCKETPNLLQTMKKINKIKMIIKCNPKRKRRGSKKRERLKRRKSLEG